MFALIFDIECYRYLELIWYFHFKLKKMDWLFFSIGAFIFIDLADKQIEFENNLCLHGSFSISNQIISLSNKSSNVSHLLKKNDVELKNIVNFKLVSKQINLLFFCFLPVFSKYE